MPNPSDGLIFVKRRAKDRRFFFAKAQALDGQKDGQNSFFFNVGIEQNKLFSYAGLKIINQMSEQLL